MSTMYAARPEDVVRNDAPDDAFAIQCHARHADGNPSRNVGYVKVASGSGWKVGIWCNECGRLARSAGGSGGIWRPLRWFDMGAMPDLRHIAPPGVVAECTRNFNFGPCAACGRVGAREVHHWAPRHLFGDEADRWPTADLCRTCHAEWHRRVTPTMAHGRHGR